VQQHTGFSHTAAGAAAEISTSKEEFLEAIYACLEAGNVVVIARHSALGTQAEDDVAQVLSCGGLEIDVGSHEIRWRGRSLKVSELEFRLFEYLARHPSRARSYRELSDAVWGPPYYGDSSALRSLVKRARRKVPPPAASGAEIKSVRGFGFRLIVRGSVAAASAGPAAPFTDLPSAPFDFIGEPLERVDEERSITARPEGAGRRVP
jgi:DNA-binding winged helix-turn-helix (wHTH) protein